MDQVFTPTVIADQPFPQTGQVETNTNQSSTSQIYSPQVITDTPLPQPIVAQELLSSALNTRSKKIIQAFQFAPSGAIQIGDYQQGVNGDIRISPNGIVARDLTGATTFALDGDTGDATFKGTLQAGSVIAGDGNVVIEESAHGGRIVLYNNGLPAILIGESS